MKFHIGDLVAVKGKPALYLYQSNQVPKLHFVFDIKRQYSYIAHIDDLQLLAKATHINIPKFKSGDFVVDVNTVDITCMILEERQPDGTYNVYDYSHGMTRKVHEDYLRKVEESA